MTKPMLSLLCLTLLGLSLTARAELRKDIEWFTINYRLYPQAKFPAPVDDVEAAIKFVKEHARAYKVDLRRVVLMGESAGGALVSYVGVRNRSALKLAAVVPFYGVHDWELRAQQEAEGKVGP